MEETLDSFDRVDHAALDELARLNEERGIVQGWLARLADQPGEVSAPVAERVSGDYRARLADLTERSRRPAAAARAEYERLGRLYEQTRAALEAATLDDEEVELRNRLGEFDADEYEQRRGRCRAELERRRSEIAEGDRVRSKFHAVLEEEEKLSAAAPPGDPPGALPVAPPSATVLLSKQSLAEAARRAAPAPAGPSATPPAGATMILRHAKLVRVAGEQEDAEYGIGLRGCVLGSAADCDVVLPTDSVAPRHAELSLGATGWRLRDLGSPGGTRVNGRPVEEAELKDGDRLELGGAALVFRHA